MFCSQCGKELPEGARFCPACGMAVVASDVQGRAETVYGQGVGEGDVPSFVLHGTKVTPYQLVDMVMDRFMDLSGARREKDVQDLRYYYHLVVGPMFEALLPGETVFGYFAGTYSTISSVPGIFSIYLLTDRRILRAAPAEGLSFKGVYEILRFQIGYLFAKHPKAHLQSIPLSDIHDIQVEDGKHQRILFWGVCLNRDSVRRCKNFHVQFSIRDQIHSVFAMLQKTLQEYHVNPESVKAEAFTNVIGITVKDEDVQELDS